MTATTDIQWHKALSSSATALIAHSREIRTDKAMDRALELARMVLEGAPNFGAAELRDPEILKILSSEGIGVATFKKALTIARKELVKPPKSSSRKGKPRSASSKSATSTQGPSSKQQDLLPGSSAMKNVPRGKL